MPSAYPGRPLAYRIQAMRLVTVFGSSKLTRDDPAYAAAYAWGRRIGTLGFGVATGGYGGAMEAVSRGVKEAGGVVVGVTAPGLFKERGGPNRHVDVELPAPSLPARIERLMDLGCAYLALPGGVGTLTELAVAWNLAYIRWLQGEAHKPIGAHPAWLEWLRPGLEIRPEHLALIQPVPDEAALEVFLTPLA